MRKVGILVGVFIVLVIGALLVFAATFDVNKYRGTIQAQFQQRLGRSVTLGDMHLKVFPPSLSVQNLAIADDANFNPEAPFVKAQELDVSVKLLPLLQKQIEINSLTLQRPSVNLIKNQEGTWNFSSLGYPASDSQSAQGVSEANRTSGAKPDARVQPGSQTSSPHAPAGQQLTLGELTIRDGQISVLDRQQAKTPSLYDHIDITLRNFAPDRPFTIDAAVHMPGAGSQEARLQGDGGPIAAGQPAATPFRGTLDLKGVSVNDLSKFLDSPALTGTDGTLTGKTKINNEAGKLTAQGEMSVQNAKMRGMELGYPINAQYDLTNDLTTDLLTIRNLILKLGSTPLQMTGTVNSKSTPAQLDLRIKANNVSIAEAAKLAAASGMALSQGTNVAGSLTADIQARGAANKPALTGNIVGSNLQMSGKDIAQPVQISSVNLKMTPSDIQSSPFNVTSGGTTLNTQFAVRNYVSPTPVVDATVRAPNAQLPAVLAMAKAYGVTALEKVNGAGTINLDVHASGPVKSITTPEIMRALNGTMKLDFNNVKYSGADVNHELAAIAGFLGSSVAQSGSGTTNISKMTGNILVKNGIAQTNDLQASLDVGNVGAAGTASLVDNTLNLRVTAVLSKTTSQKVGGNGVGGYMQTALSNNQGELVIPALVTGTFSNPRFAPDLQQIAQMKLKGLVPNLNNPASVAGTLQNLLGGAKTPAQPAASPQGEQQPQQQNPVDQLMELFGKKKKPAQQPPK
jgi:AsmA protein